MQAEETVEVQRAAVTAVRAREADAIVVAKLSGLTVVPGRSNTCKADRRERYASDRSCPPSRHTTATGMGWQGPGTLG